MLYRTSILKQPYKITSFDEVYKLQQIHQKLLIDDSSQNQLIWMGEHYLCYTLGRGANQQNIISKKNLQKSKLHRIDRGGEVTCHMPGQLVTYLILDLRHYKKDLDWYLRKLEQIIIRTLAQINIKGSIKEGLTGVWCEEKKIASIGIGCKRWVTIHGFSLNVDCDLNNFKSIIPCGIENCLMTKVVELNPNIKMIQVKEIVKKIIQEEFSLKYVSE